MEAHTGDQLLIHGRTVGQHDKVAEIVEVLGAGGTPRTASASRTDTNTWFHPVPTASYSTPTPGSRPRRLRSGLRRSALLLAPGRGRAGRFPSPPRSSVASTPPFGQRGGRTLLR